MQAEPIIESLALHELIDPRLGESYDTCELYHMARAAYLCLKSDPEMRPSMGEVCAYKSFHFCFKKLFCVLSFLARKISPITPCETDFLTHHWL